MRLGNLDRHRVAICVVIYIRRCLQQDSMRHGPLSCVGVRERCNIIIVTDCKVSSDVGWLSETCVQDS
jgi:hypothetical protein